MESVSYSFITFVLMTISSRYSTV